LDVYHTLAHGVALVRILNAGLKCAARRSLQIQDAKNLCGVEQRAPPMFGRATIRLGIGPHSSFCLIEADNLKIPRHFQVFQQEVILLQPSILVLLG